MKIVLALDRSRHSRAAAQFLDRMRWPAGSSLTLLHVLEIVPIPGGWALGRYPGLREQLAAERKKVFEPARRSLEHIGVQLRQPGLRLQVMVKRGLPMVGIVDTLKKEKAHLVVVGSRGLSGVKRFLLGSVSERVLTHAPCSVLVVRGQPRRGDTHHAGGMQVLVAFDGSPHASAAVDLLAKLGLPRSAVVTLLHVVETHDYLTSRLMATGRSDLQRLAEEVIQARKQAGARMLEKAQRVLKRRSLAVNTLVAKGHAAEAILKTAERMGADLVVMGSRGLTGMKRLLLGSVSHKVVRHAPCSVLVVRKNSR